MMCIKETGLSREEPLPLLKAELIVAGTFSLFSLKFEDIKAATVR